MNRSVTVSSPNSPTLPIPTRELEAVSRGGLWMIHGPLPEVCPDLLAKGHRLLVVLEQRLLVELHLSRGAQLGDQMTRDGDEADLIADRYCPRWCTLTAHGCRHSDSDRCRSPPQQCAAPGRRGQDRLAPTARTCRERSTVRHSAQRCCESCRRNRSRRVPRTTNRPSAARRRRRDVSRVHGGLLTDILPPGAVGPYPGKCAAGAKVEVAIARQGRTEDVGDDRFASYSVPRRSTVRVALRTGRHRYATLLLLR